MKPGYVYILQTPIFEDLKIGESDNPIRRVKELSTAVPDPFKIVYACYFKDCKTAETYIHEKLKKYRSGESEFFKITFDRALKALKDTEEKFGRVIHRKFKLKEFEKKYRQDVNERFPKAFKAKGKKKKLPQTKEVKYFRTVKSWHDYLKRPSHEISDQSRINYVNFCIKNELDIKYLNRLRSGRLKSILNKLGSEDKLNNKMCLKVFKLIALGDQRETLDFTYDHQDDDLNKLEVNPNSWTATKISSFLQESTVINSVQDHFFLAFYGIKYNFISFRSLILNKSIQKSLISKINKDQELSKGLKNHILKFVNII